VLGRFIENHLQSSQGSTKSTGSCVDGFISMEAIDLNIEASQNQLSLQNGIYNINAFHIAIITSPGSHFEGHSQYIMCLR
jgi:hypothetical protein